MKKALLIASLAVTLSGCGILPHKVEYFQRKVKAVPDVTEAAQEHQRQAAQFVAVKAEEVKVSAIETHADVKVIVPAVEAAVTAQAVTESLGPPVKAINPRSTNSAPEIVTTLHKDQAKLNEKLEAYRNTVEKDVGKKIEGTGTFQFGYFTNLALVGGGFVTVIGLLWAALKIYGVINPAVGVGTNIVGRVASSVVSRGLGEVVAGGERFKAYLETSPLAADVKAYIADLFQRGQMESQSQDVQAIISSLTKSDPITVAKAPAGAPETPKA